MRPVCLRRPPYACNSVCACTHVRTHPCMHARIIQRYADLSLEELRGEHYLRCLQPGDKSATVDAPPTGSSTDAGGVDYVRSASLQTPHLGNAMKEGLPATKPTPANDFKALGGGLEAVGYLDVAVVAVKNVPALPSLPHAFEVACTIGVDGMVSTLSLSRSSLSFSFLSFLSSLSLSLSLSSLFSLFSLFLSLTQPRRSRPPQTCPGRQRCPSIRSSASWWHQPRRRLLFQSLRGPLLARTASSLARVRWMLMGSFAVAGRRCVECRCVLRKDWGVSVSTHALHRLTWMCLLAGHSSALDRLLW